MCVHHTFLGWSETSITLTGYFQPPPSLADMRGELYVNTESGQKVLQNLVFLSLGSVMAQNSGLTSSLTSLSTSHLFNIPLEREG
jgi:hypothetical protein